MRERPSRLPRQQRPLTARRRRNLALEGLESRLVLTQVSIGLFDTGVDGTGAILPAGAADQHYTLPVTQQGAPGANAVVVSTPASGWAANGSASAWISSDANQGASSTSPVGTYHYRTTFNITNPGGGGRLSGSLGGDDDIVDVLINGVSTGYSRTGAFASLTPISLTGGLVSGANTLEFVVSNAGNGASGTGFHAKDLAINILPTLTVDSQTVAVQSGASVVNSGTFADIDPGDTVTITSSAGSVSQSGTNNGTYSYFEANVTSAHAVTITATDSRGGVKTATFNVTIGANVPPSLASGGGSANTAVSGGAGVVVDPGIVVTDPDGPNLTTASVSIGAGFRAAEDRLLFANQNGITGSYNTSTGILTLSGSANAANYQAALRSVRYQNINSTNTANTAARSISFSIAPGAYNPTTGHFYEFVASQGITWTAARSAALSRSIFGLQGYLATLTSAAENTFAFSKVNSVGWIGASDAAVEGDWRWMDGPEAGQLFYRGLGTSNGAAVNGLYNNWASGEPNDAGGEDYAHYLANGQWNDYANATPVQGYVVEYGGSAGDPTLTLTSSASVNVANQTARPTVATPSAAASTNAATATIAGTAAAGSLVQVYDDANGNGILDAGEQVVTSSQLGAGVTSFGITVPLAANAANRFLVTATASPSVESTVAVVPTITQDSVAPATPAVTSPAAATTVDADDIAIIGTAEAGSLVQVFLDANGNGVLDAGESAVASQQLGAGQTAFSITTPLAADSANRFLVASTDAAGNLSAAAALVVTEDSTPPAAPVSTSPAGPVTLNAATTTITGTAEAGSLVRAYRDTNGNGLFDIGEPMVDSLQLAPGQTDYTLTIPLEADAENLFVVTATDAANNRSAATAVAAITQDSTIPASPTVTSPAGALAINAATATITGTAEAGSLVRAYRDSNNNGVLDAGEVAVGLVQLAAGQTTYSITVPLDPNAANDFVVTATDAGGNESAPADVPTIAADSIAPAAPVVTSPAAAITVNADTIAVAGTAEAGSLVQVFVDLNGNGIIDAGEPAAGSLQLGAGQTAYTITVPLAADLANRLLVASTDAAGNRSAAASLVVTEDSTAPDAPAPGSPSGPITVNATTATLTGTAEAGSLVRAYRDSNNNGVLDDGEPVVGSQQLEPGQTAYSIAVPLNPDAENHFLIVATDAGGNPSPTVAVPTITQDSTAPGAPAPGSPAGPVTLNTATTTLTGTAEAGSLVQVYDDLNGNGVLDDGEPVVGSQQLEPGQTAYSIQIALKPGQPNRFLVVATDAGGNRSPAVAVPTITQDSTPPAGPAVDGPGGPTAGPAGKATVNAMFATLTGTAEPGSLVQVYDDLNGNGVLDDGEPVVGSQQLEPGQTSYAIRVPLTRDSANRFLVATTDAGGNRSPAVAVPTITQDSTPPAPPALVRTTSDARFATLTGTAEPGSLVQVYDDLNGNGVLDEGEAVVGSQQLEPGQTSYAIRVALKTGQTNRFLIAATDAAGNRSSAYAVAGLVAGTPIAGTVYLDVNANNVQDAGEVGLAARAVFVDQNGNGVLDDGEPVAFTGPDGSFSFPGAFQGTEAVLESIDPDATMRHVVAQTRILADGSVSIGVVPFSPVAPVHVTPNPFDGGASADPDAAFIQSLYRAVLGRTGAGWEIQAWRDRMARGMDRAGVAQGFVNSAEHRWQQVESFYETFLGRSTDVSAGHWVGLLMGGASEERIAEAILNSAEYQASHQDAATFIRDLYLDVLGREGEGPGVADHVAALASGTGRSAIVARFVQSPEATDQILGGFYSSYLRRKRDVFSSTWAVRLNAEGASPSSVAVGILASDEFYRGGDRPS